MKKFKNVIALFTIAACIFSSTACGSNAAKDTSSDSDVSVEETEEKDEERETEAATVATENLDPYADLRNYDNEFYHHADDDSTFIVIPPTIPQEGYRPIFLRGENILGISYKDDETNIVVRVAAAYYPDDDHESWAAAKPDSLGGVTTTETVSYNGVEREVIVNVDAYSRTEFYTIEADQGVYEIQVFMSNYVNRHDEYDRDMVDSFINAFMDDVVFTHRS